VVHGDGDVHTGRMFAHKTKEAEEEDDFKLQRQDNK
jgi:hypothetical protein